MLDPSAFITTQPDDALSIRHANDLKGFIADFLFAPHYVQKESHKLWQYDGSGFRTSRAMATSKAEAAKIDFGGFYTDRTCKLRKLSMDVDPNDEANVDKQLSDLMGEAKLTIMERLMLDKELEAVTKATTAGNYPSGLVTSVASGSRWNETGGDPRSNVRAARELVRLRTGKLANAMAISRTTFEKLKQSPALVEQMRYTSGMSITVDILKNLLELEHLFVGDAVQNTNVEGNATQTLSDVWGTSAVVFIYDPTARLKTVQYGVQPIFTTLYSHVAEDPKRGGPKGRIQTVEMGLSYSLDAGSVVSSSDSDFIGGSLLTTVVA